MGRIEVGAGKLPSIVLGLLALMLVPAVVALPFGPAFTCGALALLLVGAAIALGKRRLVVDDDGVTAINVFGKKHVAWNDVSSYTFWSMDQSVNVAAGAAGGVLGIAIAAVVVAAVNARRSNSSSLDRQFSVGRLRIVTRDRRAISIDARYRELEPALDRAFHELHDRLRARQYRDYAPFAVSDTAILHRRKGSLALAEIERISVAGARFVVKKRGKRFAWARVHMRDVTNGLLLLEELAERGVAVTTNAGTFVPPSILQKLIAATSRQAALPAARIVQR